MNSDNGALDFEAYMNNEKLIGAINEAEKRVKGFSTATVKEGEMIDRAFADIGKAVAGYFSIQALTAFSRSLIDVRGEFQQLEVAFETMLGSKGKADDLMAQIVDTAAKTPFTLTQVAAGAKQLLAYQVAAEDVNDTIIRLGNIAAGVSVPLDRLIMAYGQVKAKGKLMGDDMRQFTEAGIPMIHELAKIMGVADNQISKLVEDGKVGFPQVQQVISNLTNESGMFFNLMEKQSHTLTGQISNLQDAWSQMLNDIGQDSEGFISNVISGTTSAVNSFKGILDVIIPLVKVYGGYKAAVILVNIANKEAAAINAMVAASNGVLSKGLASQWLWTERVQKAQSLLNKTMLTNPFVLAATAITALIIILNKLANASSEAEKAKRRLNDAMEEANDQFQEEKSKSESLIAVINDEANSREYRNQKLKELIALSPEHLKGLTLDSIRTIEGKAAIDDYVKSLEKKIKLQRLESELNESIKRLQDAREGDIEQSFFENAKIGLSSSLSSIGMGRKAEIVAEYASGKSQEIIDAERKLQEQIKKEIAEFSNEVKNTGKNDADVIINAKYWEDQVKTAKEALDNLDTNSKNYAADHRKLIEQIIKGEAELDKIRSYKKKQAKPREKNNLSLMTGRSASTVTESDHDEDYNKLLKEFGSFQQKKLQISEEFDKKRAIATKNNDLNLINELNKAQADVMSGLSLSELENSDMFKELFGNLDQLTVDRMIYLRDKIEAEWEKLKLSPEVLSALRNRLDEVAKEVETRNPFTALSEAIKKYNKDQSKENFKEIARGAAAAIDLVSGSFDAVVGGLDKMGVKMDEGTQQVINDISGVMKGASDLAMGIATGNPLQIVQGTIAVLSNGIDLIFGGKDRRRQRQIEQHAEVVNQLTEAYNDLERAIGKALGGDTYKNQQQMIDNLEKQRAEYLQMIELEKGKKKSDGDKIKEYEQAYKDAGLKIEDVIDSIKLDILQTNAKDFADQLGDALVEAFGKGENAAEAFGSTVDSILKNAILNQLKKNFLEKQLEGALKGLESSMGYWSGDEFIFDGLTDAEESAFRDKIAQISKNFSVALDQYAKSIPGMTDMSQNSLSGAIKGVSEETASIISGQMNAIRINQMESIDVLRNQLLALNRIQENTSYNKFLTYLKSIYEKLSSNDSLRAKGL